MSKSITPPIPDFVRKRVTEIDALCKKHQVARLELFGSAVTGKFDPASSDLDFLMEFESGLDPDLKLDAYLDFNMALERLFGRKVDLTFFRAVKNPYVLKAIQEQRTTLYAA